MIFNPASLIAAANTACSTPKMCSHRRGTHDAINAMCVIVSPQNGLHPKSDGLQPTSLLDTSIVRMLLVAMPGAPSSKARSP